MTDSEIQQMKEIAKDILDYKIDAIEGINELECLKDNKDDELALLIASITSDTDEIVLSSNKAFYSKEFLENQEKWKEEYAKEMWPTITEICNAVLNL